MKSITVQDFDLIIFHLETGFSSKGNKKKERLKSKLNPLYRKKKSFECAGRFSDFFINKKEGSKVQEKQTVFLLNLSYSIGIISSFE